MAQSFAASADQEGGKAPEWVHLLPAGEIKTSDARGPYQSVAADRLIAASFAEMDRLPIDENHATDLAAPLGMPAPARGWIVAMEARADGIWGKVEWTEEGRKMVAGRAYRGVSPVVLHDTSKTIGRILRASLVNKPNLRGLAALHQESNMTLLERLAELLGLDAASSEAQIIEAVAAKVKPKSEDDAAPALQSQMSEIGQVLGLGQGSDAAAILSAARMAAAGSQAITALQSELTTVSTELNTLKRDGAKTKAEAFVDGEIRKGRVGVKPLRDHYIAMHIEDATRVEKELGALPMLGANNTLATPPVSMDGQIALNASQSEAARLLGIAPEAYQKTLKAEAL